MWSARELTILSQIKKELLDMSKSRHEKLTEIRKIVDERLNEIEAEQRKYYSYLIEEKLIKEMEGGIK